MTKKVDYTGGKFIGHGDGKVRLCIGHVRHVSNTGRRYEAIVLADYGGGLEAFKVNDFKRLFRPT